MKKYTWRITLIFFGVQIFLFALGYFFYLDLKNNENLLLVFMAFLLVIEVVLVFTLYQLLKKKYNDIEISRSKFLSSKPYLIKINAHGKIKSFNNTCQANLKEINNFKSIFDFDIEKNLDLEEALLLQKPFIANAEGKKSKIVLRFMSLKTTGGYYLFGEDITAGEESIDYYRKLAMDNLITGLPNKNFLSKRLEQLFSDKEAMAKKNAMVEINIEDFKKINRLFGVKFGDECLIKLAKVLEHSLKAFNFQIFHLHADDFMILFFDLNDYEEVVDWTEKISKFLQKAIDVAGNLIILEIKVGILNLEVDIYPNINQASAIENVALALKKAKGSRRIRYYVYDMGLGQHFTREQAMENDLLNALRNNEMTMYYQPQVFINRRKVYGLEALIRWNNPKYINESPVHFIKLAEENNLIVDLGRFVFEETFKFAKEIEPYNIRISINVSPVQILHAGFVNEITNAFKKYKLPPNSICLEITETFLMESYDLIINKLVNLKQLGISIHLDNFGSGYSSLAYLKDLPIDSVSLGQEFIRAINTDRKVRLIVSKLISLVQSLELEVIGEGVEDDKQNRFLTEAGCKVVQGYLISKPLPKSSVMKFINDYDFRLPSIDDLR